MAADPHASQNIDEAAKKLVPADPSSCEVIRQVTPEITIVSAPFSRLGLFKVGSRASIIKLYNNSLAVFSPSALSPAVRATVRELGDNVAYLIAPDFEHHIFITQWAKEFPNAIVIGVEGLPEKRQKDPMHKDVPFAHVFTSKQRTISIDPVFDKEFDVEYVAAHGNKELAINHRASGTLIQADLLWNLPAFEQYSRTPGGSQEATKGLASKAWNGLLNTRDGNKLHQRFLWHAIAQDKADFSESIKRINAWDWDRIIPCHGEVIENNAKPVFQSIFTWFLEGKK